MAIARISSALAVVFAAAAFTCGHASADPCDDAITKATPIVTDAYNKRVYDSVYKEKLGAEKDSGSPTAINAAKEAKKAATTIGLGDIVTIKGEKLDSLFDKACINRSIILYLNNWPLTDVAPLPPLDARLGELNFKLVNKRHADTSRDPWLPILGSPSFSGVPVAVSLGFASGFAMQQKGVALPSLTLTVLPIWWFLLWTSILLLMVCSFWYLARETTILRDTAPSTPDAKGPYSLARAQGAVWFFVILAAYLFIGIITGDFSNSINSTALTLMGIGAGTVLGSAVIDAQKDTQQQRKDIQEATTRVSNEINSPPPTGGVPQDNLESQLKKLNGESEGFFIDIVSDANGISFHRFQNAVWTLVLAIIFLFAVYQNLAMPEFNPTLLGLLGLSAGTYLGLKIPEPTTPTRPALKPAPVSSGGVGGGTSGTANAGSAGQAGGPAGVAGGANAGGAGGG